MHTHGPPSPACADNRYPRWSVAEQGFKPGFGPVVLPTPHPCLHSSAIQQHPGLPTPPRPLPAAHSLSHLITSLRHTFPARVPGVPHLHTSSKGVDPAPFPAPACARTLPSLIAPASFPPCRLLRISRCLAEKYWNWQKYHKIPNTSTVMTTANELGHEVDP